LCKKDDQSPEKAKVIETNPNARIKAMIKQAVEGNATTIVMAIFTLFALVGDDIRLASTEKSADVFFTIGLMICLILFTLEILGSSVAVDDYKYSFFFYLDIIATLSIIADVNFLLNALISVWGSSPHFLSVNAEPGVIYVENTINGKL
jgi:hypothetical protein